MKNYKVYQLVLILAPFVFSFAFGLDIYIPIVPQMTVIFDTNHSLIQLTLSLFLFATGAGQLIIGPLSDQYGRKKIFYLSALFFAIGCLACALSTNIIFLLLSRLLSAFGACGLLVTSFALVRDMYSKEESAKIYSFLEGAIGISPTFAPIIGGYLAVFFGWQSVFIFLACLGMFSFCITKSFIKETHPRENRTPLDRTILRRYKNICKNSQFLSYSIISGLAEGVFFSFFSISPFIIIDLLGYPTENFGFYFAIFGLAVAISGFTSGKVIEKYGLHHTVVIGLSLMLVGGGMMMSWHFIEQLSLAGFLIPTAIACMGAMFLIGVSAAMALEPFGEIPGTASAALGAIEFGVASLTGSILMLFPVTSTLSYGVTILLLTSLSGVIYVKQKQTQVENV